MTGRTWLVLAVTAIAWLAVPATPATAGGGGCHSGMTQGTGGSIVIRDGCFAPGILQVAPGTIVAFSNQDPYLHNVSANGWGFLDGLDRGDGFTATFDEPGVYPFACTLHPGMAGAVVVGDGTGAGNGALVAVGSLEAPAEVPVSEPVDPVATTRPAAGRWSGWVLAGAIGLVLGLGLGVLGRRRAVLATERPDVDG